MQAAATTSASAARALYARLPRGPHRLGRPAVADNQRGRMLGAMVQAVADGGYREASVSRVVALAGVSRRSFYEHFANREACFLAAFDAISAHAGHCARRAWASAPGDRADRLRGALAALADAVGAEPDAAALVACEARLAGGAALVHMRRRLMQLERPLGERLAPPGGPALPGPVMRAVAGGLHGVVASALRRSAHARDGRAGGLAAPLTCWVLPFAAPADGAALTRGLAASAAARLREPPATSPSARRRPRSGSDADRVVLMAAALRLAVLGDYGAVPPQQLADEAGLPLRALARCFDDTQACYAAALKEVSATVLAAVEDASARTYGDWPQAVLAMLDALLATLASRPLRAHTLATGIHSAGAAALERGEDLMLAVAGLLAAGAPRAPASGAGPEADRALAAGLLHAIACQAASGRPQLLAALSDPLAFAVLASHLGAAEAGERLLAVPARGSIV